MYVSLPIKKVSQIVFLLFIVSAGGLGQENYIEIGYEIKNKRHFNFKDFIHSDESGFYTYYMQGSFLSPSKGELFLEKYDHNYKMIFSSQMHVPNKNTRDHGIRYFGNQLLWLTSVHDKSEKKLDFYLTPIDLKGNQGKAKLLSTLKLARYNKLPEVEWVFSPDSTKMLLFANIYTSSQNLNFAEYFCVFNNTYEIINEVTIDFGTNARKTEVVDYILMNDGSVFFANQNLRKKRNMRSDYQFTYLNDKGKPSDVHIYRLGPNEKSPKEFDIFKGTERPKTLKFAVDSDDYLVIAGLYGDPGTAVSKGIFLTKLKGSGYEEIILKQSRLPKIFNTNVNKHNLLKTTDKTYGLSNIVHTKDIVMLNSGNLFVIHEGVYSKMKNRSRNDINISYKLFTTTDKFVTQYDNQGNVLGNYLIPQNLTFQQYDFLSYFPVNTGNHFFMLYNDIIKNIENNMVQDSKYGGANENTSKIGNVLADFETNGSYARTLISTRKELESVIMPVYCKLLGGEIYYISRRVGLFATELGEKYYVGKIKLHLSDN